MKRGVVVVVALVFLGSVRGEAQDRGIGLGVIVGDPTGISTKIWTTSSNALQFAVAWRAEDQFLGTRVDFSGDYLWHSFDAIHSEHRFPVFYGVGGEIASGGGFESAFGIRGVVGIEWMSRQAPFDIFIQVVPVLVLSPSTELDLGAGFGVRYFFN